MKRTKSEKIRDWILKCCGYGKGPKLNGLEFNSWVRTDDGMKVTYLRKDGSKRIFNVSIWVEDEGK